MVNCFAAAAAAAAAAAVGPRVETLFDSICYACLNTFRATHTHSHHAHWNESRIMMGISRQRWIRDSFSLNPQILELSSFHFNTHMGQIHLFGTFSTGPHWSINWIDFITQSRVVRPRWFNYHHHCGYSNTHSNGINLPTLPTLTTLVHLASNTQPSVPVTWPLVGLENGNVLFWREGGGRQIALHHWIRLFQIPVLTSKCL